MSADDQAAISEASSYGGGGTAGRRPALPGRVLTSKVPTGCGNRFWAKMLLLNVRKATRGTAGGGPGWTTQLLPARGAAGPGVLLLGAGRCVHRLLNGSINA